MRARQSITSERAPRGVGPYSPALKAAGLVFVSGQGAVDPETLAVVGGTIGEQARYTLDKVMSLLAAAGSGPDEVMKVTVYLANLDDVGQFNAVYETYFSEPRPARTTIGCALPGLLVAMDCIALAA